MRLIEKKIMKMTIQYAKNGKEQFHYYSLCRKIYWISGIFPIVFNYLYSCIMWYQEFSNFYS